MPYLVNISNALADWLVPQACLLCGDDSNTALCRPCYRELPWLQRACAICALPLDSPGTCSHCLRKQPSFDRCVSAFQYARPIGPLINQFKRHRNFRVGGVLTGALSNTLQAKYVERDLPDCIVPVPLHWRRTLTRGFNQATFIGQDLARDLGVPVKPLLRRTLATSKQQGSTRKQRLMNLKHAFDISGAIELPDYVALVDDVITTGATAEAASARLKHAGVKRVDLWVLARTPETSTTETPGKTK